MDWQGSTVVKSLPSVFMEVAGFSFNTAQSWGAGKTHKRIGL